MCGRFKILPARRGKSSYSTSTTSARAGTIPACSDVAFHPGFATNHAVFVYYTWVKPGTVAGDPYTRPNPMLPDTYHDRLSRFTLDANGVAIPGSETVFIDQTDETIWHHGGGMFFHPTNGFLYLTIGDNADGNNTQIINKSLFSGVFRIDVDCRGGAVSHPDSAPAGQRRHGELFHSERQSIRRRIQRAGGFFLSRPAQSAPHDL